MIGAHFILEFIGLFFLIPVLKSIFSFNYYPQKREETLNLSHKDGRASFLRGISIIGIVIIHIDSYFRYFHNDSFTNLTFVLSNLSRFSVPIFFLTSGIYLSWKGWKHFLVSRILYILVPYVVFSLVGYILKSHSDIYTLKDFLYKILTGSVFEPFYFIPVIFQFYVLYFFLRNIQWTNQKRVFAVLLTLVINMLANILEDFVPISLPEEFKKICSLNFIFFFILGLAFKNFFIEFHLCSYPVSSKLHFINSVFLLVFIGIVIFETYTINYQITNYHLYYPIGVFIFVYSIFHVIERVPKFTQHISMIGDNSFAIFLIHPLIMHFFHSVDPYFIEYKLLICALVFLINIYLPLFSFYMIKLFLKKIVTS